MISSKWKTWAESQNPVVNMEFSFLRGTSKDLAKFGRIKEKAAQDKIAME